MLRHKKNLILPGCSGTLVLPLTANLINAYVYKLVADLSLNDPTGATE